MGKGYQRRLLEDLTRPPASEQPTVVYIQHDQSKAVLLTALVVALPVFLGLLSLLLAALLWRQCRRNRTLAGSVRPPGVGPQTTLLVTDIMNSTVLWESIPATAMDKAVRLHHACIRKLLRLYNGYESATEGDCFILAFHAPADAARYALAAQMDLMDQPWPQELLEHPDACEVWVSCPPAWKSPFEVGPTAKGDREDRDGYNYIPHHHIHALINQWSHRGCVEAAGRDASIHGRTPGDTRHLMYWLGGPLHRRTRNTTGSHLVASPVRGVGGAAGVVGVASGGNGMLPPPLSRASRSGLTAAGSTATLISNPMAAAVAATTAASNAAAGHMPDFPRLRRASLHNLAASWRLPIRRGGGGAAASTNVQPSNYMEETCVQLVQRERMSVSAIPAGPFRDLYGISGKQRVNYETISYSGGGPADAERLSGGGRAAGDRSIMAGRQRRHGSICAAYSGGMQNHQLGNHLQGQLAKLQTSNLPDSCGADADDSRGGASGASGAEGSDRDRAVTAAHVRSDSPAAYARSLPSAVALSPAGRQFWARSSLDETSGARSQTGWNLVVRHDLNLALPSTASSRNPPDGRNRSSVRSSSDGRLQALESRDWAGVSTSNPATQERPALGEAPLDHNVQQQFPSLTRTALPLSALKTLLPPFESNPDTSGTSRSVTLGAVSAAAAAALNADEAVINYATPANDDGASISLNGATDDSTTVENSTTRPTNVNDIASSEEAGKVEGPLESARGTLHGGEVGEETSGGETGGRNADVADTPVYLGSAAPGIRLRDNVPWSEVASASSTEEQDQTVGVNAGGEQDAAADDRGINYHKLKEENGDNNTVHNQGSLSQRTELLPPESALVAQLAAPSPAASTTPTALLSEPVPIAAGPFDAGSSRGIGVGGGGSGQGCNAYSYDSVRVWLASSDVGGSGGFGSVWHTRSTAGGSSSDVKVPVSNRLARRRSLFISSGGAIGAASGSAAAAGAVIAEHPSRLLPPSRLLLPVQRPLSSPGTTMGDDGECDNSITAASWERKQPPHRLSQPAQHPGTASPSARAVRELRMGLRLLGSSVSGAGSADRAAVSEGNTPPGTGSGAVSPGGGPGSVDAGSLHRASTMSNSERLELARYTSLSVWVHQPAATNRTSAGSRPSAPAATAAAAALMAIRTARSSAGGHHVGPVSPLSSGAVSMHAYAPSLPQSPLAASPLPPLADGDDSCRDANAAAATNAVAAATAPSEDQAHLRHSVRLQTPCDADGSGLAAATWAESTSLTAPNDDHNPSTISDKVEGPEGDGSAAGGSLLSPSQLSSPFLSQTPSGIGPPPVDTLTTDSTSYSIGRFASSLAGSFLPIQPFRTGPHAGSAGGSGSAAVIVSPSMGSTGVVSATGIDSSAVFGSVSISNTGIGRARPPSKSAYAITAGAARSATIAGAATPAASPMSAAAAAAYDALGAGPPASGLMASEPLAMLLASNLVVPEGGSRLWRIGEGSTHGGGAGDAPLDLSTQASAERVRRSGCDIGGVVDSAPLPNLALNSGFNRSSLVEYAWPKSIQAQHMLRMSQGSRDGGSGNGRETASRHSAAGDAGNVGAPRVVAAASSVREARTLQQVSPLLGLNDGPPLYSGSGPTALEDTVPVRWQGGERRAATAGAATSATASSLLRSPSDFERLLVDAGVLVGRRRKSTVSGMGAAARGIYDDDNDDSGDSSSVSSPRETTISGSISADVLSGITASPHLSRAPSSRQGGVMEADAFAAMEAEHANMPVTGDLFPVRHDPLPPTPATPMSMMSAAVAANTATWRDVIGPASIRQVYGSGAASPAAMGAPRPVSTYAYAVHAASALCRYRASGDMSHVVSVQRLAGGGTASTGDGSRTMDRTGKNLEDKAAPGNPSEDISLRPHPVNHLAKRARPASASGMYDIRHGDVNRGNVANQTVGLQPYSAKNYYIQPYTWWRRGAAAEMPAAMGPGGGAHLPVSVVAAGEAVVHQLPNDESAARTTTVVGPAQGTGSASSGAFPRSRYAKPMDLLRQISKRIMLERLSRDRIVRTDMPQKQHPSGSAAANSNTTMLDIEDCLPGDGGPPSSTFAAALSQHAPVVAPSNDAAAPTITALSRMSSRRSNAPSAAALSHSSLRRSSAAAATTSPLAGIFSRSSSNRSAVETAEVVHPRQRTSMHGKTTPPSQSCMEISQLEGRGGNDAGRRRNPLVLSDGKGRREEGKDRIPDETRYLQGGNEASPTLQPPLLVTVLPGWYSRRVDTINADAGGGDVGHYRGGVPAVGSPPQTPGVGAASVRSSEIGVCYMPAPRNMPHTEHEQDVSVRGGTLPINPVAAASRSSGPLAAAAMRSAVHTTVRQSSSPLFFATSSANVLTEHGTGASNTLLYASPYSPTFAADVTGGGGAASLPHRQTWGEFLREAFPILSASIAGLVSHNAAAAFGSTLLPHSILATNSLGGAAGMGAAHSPVYGHGWINGTDASVHSGLAGIPSSTQGARRGRNSRFSHIASGGPALAFRGLRVRMGLHTGITNPADCAFNHTTGAVAYTGAPLKIAKAVADAAAGAMILASERTLHQLLPILPLLDSRPPMAVYCGDVELEGLICSAGTVSATNATAAAAAAIAKAAAAAECSVHSSKAGELPTPAQSPLHPTPMIAALLKAGAASSLQGPAAVPGPLAVCSSRRGVALYQIVGYRLRQRMPHLAPLRGLSFVQIGNTDAPVGSSVAITFLTVPSAQVLKTDLDDVAIRALTALKTTVIGLCTRRGGYVIEAAEGLCLAAFHDPVAAAVWALSCVDTLRQMDWPAAVLRHPQCAEVYESPVNTVAGGGAVLPEPQVYRDNGKGGGGTGGHFVRRLLHRGPRIRVGMHVGEVTCEVHSSTGRLSYRGRVMNRASRIAYKAHDGQVVCSRTAWTLVQHLLPGSAIEIERVQRDSGATGTTLGGSHGAGTGVAWANSARSLLTGIPNNAVAGTSGRQGSGAVPRAAGIHTTPGRTLSGDVDDALVNVGIGGYLRSSAAAAIVGSLRARTSYQGESVGAGAGSGGGGAGPGGVGAEYGPSLRPNLGHTSSSDLVLSRAVAGSPGGDGTGAGAGGSTMPSRWSPVRTAGSSSIGGGSFYPTPGARQVGVPYSAGTQCSVSRPRSPSPTGLLNAGVNAAPEFASRESRPSPRHSPRHSPRERDSQPAGLPFLGTYPYGTVVAGPAAGAPSLVGSLGTAASRQCGSGYPPSQRLGSCDDSDVPTGPPSTGLPASRAATHTSCNTGNLTVEEETPMPTTAEEEEANAGVHEPTAGDSGTSPTTRPPWPQGTGGGCGVPPGHSGSEITDQDVPLMLGTGYTTGQAHPAAATITAAGLYEGTWGMAGGGGGSAGGPGAAAAAVCSRSARDSDSGPLGNLVRPLHALSLGSFQLKGIAELMELMELRWG